MRNGERKGTFRYATLTRDRFFSLIRHSAALMTALVSREKRFFFFLFFSFKNGYTTLVHNNPRLHGAATVNLNYYTRKKFSYLPTSSRESLELPAYDIKRALDICVALLAFPVFLAFLFFKIILHKITGIWPNIFKIPT